MELEAKIRKAYIASGNELGWRFLYSPSSVLFGADVAFIGLNPGGAARHEAHAEFAMQTGSAYLHECWAGYPAGHSSLQTQVRRLFGGLGVKAEAVLAGNLVPFRSRNWATLEQPQYSLKFGQGIWLEVLLAAQPSLVVTMGGQTFDSLAAALQVEDVECSLLGWGKVKGRKAHYSRSGSLADGLLVGLPHLSRFRIVGREASREGLAGLFGHPFDFDKHQL